MAGAAARAPRAADRAPGPRRQDPALSLRAVDPGQVGRAARALHARVLAADRAPARRRRRRGRNDDHRARVPGRADPAAHQLRQHDAEARRLGGDASRRMVPAAAAHARAVVGHVVLRGPRQPHRPAPPLACAARGPRAVPRHASAARAAAAERRGARAEDQEPAAVGKDRAPERAARARHQARVAGRSGVQAVRAPRRAHVGRGHRRRDRRLRQDLGLPARGGAGADAGARARQELRRHDGARRVRPRAQRGRPPARAGAAPARQRSRRRADRGK